MTRHHTLWSLVGLRFICVDYVPEVKSWNLFIRTAGVLIPGQPIRLRGSWCGQGSRIAEGPGCQRGYPAFEVSQIPRRLSPVDLEIGGDLPKDFCACWRDGNEITGVEDGMNSLRISSARFDVKQHQKGRCVWYLPCLSATSGSWVSGSRRNAPAARPTQQQKPRPFPWSSALGFSYPGFPREGRGVAPSGK